MIITLEARNAYFGGITLCPNEFFLKDRISNNLKYISGAFQVYRSSKKSIPISKYRHFEDYHYNIQYFLRDGIICRWDGVIPKTKNYNPIGGICDDYGSLELRLQDAEIVAKELCQKYSKSIVSSYYKKASSRCPACINLKLNHRYIQLSSESSSVSGGGGEPSD